MRTQAAVVKISDHPKHRTSRPIAPISYQARRDIAFADALFKSLVATYGNCEFFTREDCLYLPVVQHIAKITAYHEVCKGLDRLKQERRITEIARSELCIAGYEHLVIMVPLVEQYQAGITSIVRANAGTEEFGVMDVVKWWRGGSNLTDNAKRIAARQTLRRLVSQGVLVRSEFHTYKLAGV